MSAKKLTKVKIKTQFDLTYEGEKGEVNDMESMTQPDMSLTIRQLLVNHTRGLHQEQHFRSGAYSDEFIIPQFDDITDLIEHRKMLQSQMEEMDKVIQREKAIKDGEIEKAADGGTGDSKNEVDVQPSGKTPQKSDTGKQSQPSKKED